MNSDCNRKRGEAMKYVSIDQLEQFEFHDSVWELCAREGDSVTFLVENLNIHKGTEQNDEDYDMELATARMTFRGFRLIHFEPGQSWTTDENGNSVPVGERILYTGEEGMTRLGSGNFEVYHLCREGDHWEFGGCGLEPYFTVEFNFDSVELAWDAYAKKAWYELRRYCAFPVVLDTPDGTVSEKLEIWVNEEPVYRVNHGWIQAPSVAAGVCWGGTRYLGDGTDDFLWIDAIADLQKKLPAGITIRACLTCRHGNLCPYGNAPKEVFCLKDVEVSGKMDVAALCDDPKAWESRKKSYFDCGDCWAETSDDFYTYNDFADFLKK